MKGLFVKDLKLMMLQKNFLLLILAIVIGMMIFTDDVIFPLGFLSFIVSLFTVSTISYDDFKSFVDYLVSSGNSQMADENAVYKYYGGGNKEDGKKTLRQLYVVNQAISYVVEKANITVEPDTQTTESPENERVQ